MDKAEFFKPLTDAERKALRVLPSDWLAKIGKEVKAKPNRWTQMTFARDKKGNPVNFWDPKATCWCIEGFIARDLDSDDDLRGRVRAALLRARKKERRWRTLPLYNDNEISNPSEFLSWLRAAYKFAKESEQRKDS